MRRRQIDPTRWVVGLLIFAMCVFAALNTRGHDAQTLPRALYNDATPLGGKGLRLILEKLGYTTARQTEPVQTMPQDAKIWLILDPETRFTKRELPLLLKWVRQGGVLVYCIRPDDPFSFNMQGESAGIEGLRKTLGCERSQLAASKYSLVSNTDGFLPELSALHLDAVSNYRTGVSSANASARTFEISRPYLEIAGAPGGTLARFDVGKGHVFVAPDALLFTNYALSKPDNAVLVTNLLRAHVPRGAVYFDERQSGEVSETVSTPTIITYLKRPPTSYAVLQLMLSGLLFWAFAGRRLGAPVALPDGGPVTRASQFAAAMGALFSKINRPQAAWSIIGTQFRRRLAMRLGLSPAESDMVLAKRAQEVAGIPFEVTDRLLLQGKTPISSLGEALRDAQEMEKVLRKLEGE